MSAIRDNNNNINNERRKRNKKKKKILYDEKRQQHFYCSRVETKATTAAMRGKREIPNEKKKEIIALAISVVI